MNKWLFFVILVGLACTADEPGPEHLPEAKPVASQLPISFDTPKVHYPWKEVYDPQQSIRHRISAPQGFQRIPLDSTGFGQWLRHLPLRSPGAPVHLYNGELKVRQDVHWAVVDMDVGERDLQQCADAVMRLKAEYHYSREEYPRIHFNFTSGDRVSFDDWRKGRKPAISGHQVRFSSFEQHTDNSYQNFRSYLIQVFSYAGTASLAKEMHSRALEEIEVGDVFIKGGFPGHAIIVVDEVRNEAGEKRFLLAQSYMPAQELHILKNPFDPSSPWYSLPSTSRLLTPEWDFSTSDLKYFD